MQSLATLTVVLSVVLSAAGQATTLPQCASGCADHAASTVGCALTDTPCLCKTSFASSVLQCAGTTSCSAADQTRVSNILEAMCDIASVSSSGSGGSSGPVVNPSSVSQTLTLNPSPSLSLSQTTVTSVVTSVLPPLTTTFTTQVPVSVSVPASTSSIVVPPLSPPAESLPSSSPTAPLPSSQIPSPPSAPSTSPSTAGAQGRNVRGADVAGAVLGVVVAWLL